MAVDYALLEAARGGRTFLRLYRWAPPCLSLGRNEPATTRYSRTEIERLGLSVVRRPTGGRAVWHEAELTYAVAGPEALFGSLPEAYRAIHRLLLAALGRLGLRATLAEPAGRAARPGAGACFARPAGGEIVVGDRKLVGSAQVREGGTFLQHGSLLLDDGQDVVRRITRGDAPPATAAALCPALGRPVAFEEAAAAVIAAAEAQWGAPGNSPAPEPRDLARFTAADWTWRR